MGRSNESYPDPQYNDDEANTFSSRVPAKPSAVSGHGRLCERLEAEFVPEASDTDVPGQ